MKKIMTIEEIIAASRQGERIECLSTLKGDKCQVRQSTPILSRPSVKISTLYGYVISSEDHLWFVTNPITRKTDIVTGEYLSRNPHLGYLLGMGNNKHAVITNVENGYRTLSACLESSSEKHSFVILLKSYSDEGRRNRILQEILEKHGFWLNGKWHRVKPLPGSEYLITENGVKNHVLSESELIEIGTYERRMVESHNCLERMVCGFLNSTESLMAIKSTRATKINTEAKGEGILYDGGGIQNVRYYFPGEAPLGWIRNWWKDRGFDDMGWWGEGDTTLHFNDSAEYIDLEVKSQTFELESDGVKRTVESRVDQTFTEI